MSEGSSGPSAPLRRPTSAPTRSSPGRGSRATRSPPGGLAASDDDGLQRRQRDPGVLEHGDVVVAQEIGDGHEGPGPAPGQHVGRLGALEPRVHRDQDPAGGEDPEDRDHPLDAVECPYGDPVARLDPGGDQGGPKPVGGSRSSAKDKQCPRPGRPPDRRTVRPPWPPWPGSKATSRPQDAHRRGPGQGASGPENGALSTQKCYFRTATVTESPGGLRPPLLRARRDVHSCGRPYYDPYDFEIDADPYPIWKRLRDEAPLYYNEKYDFFAVSRYDDVERCLVDWQTYSSARGSVLEIIKANAQMPPGLFIFEDPPDHDLHRGLLSRVFTPRRLAAIEPQVRAFAARSLGRLEGAGGFDFIADLGTELPMRTIGMLLGVPEDDQQALRERMDEGLRLEDGVMPDLNERTFDPLQSEYAEYIDWRVSIRPTT